MSYEETLAYIHSVKWQGSKPGLSRTRALLSALGNPERQLRFVHIAGTNGKGSTAACIASCLQAAGWRVGLYTSPYINRFNERMQVNGVPISDEDLETLVDRIRPIANALTDSPTEFELITALGFLYFLQMHCDIVVLEVGLGGALDSTNVIPAPEAAVITALGLDHTAVLGDTIQDVARAKAGIIKAGAPVITYGGVPEADAVIAAVCKEQGCSLYPVDFSQLTLLPSDLSGSRFSFGNLSNLTLPLLGSYQPKNAAVAITTLKVLDKQGWHISDAAIREGLRTVQWPGRFELLRTDPPFLLDGSHNPHGMRATAQSLQDRFPQQKFTFLISVMADKEVTGILTPILPLAKEFVTVRANLPRAMPAEELAARIIALGGTAQAAPSISAGVALAQSLAGANGPICALGTLYFSADVRQALAEQSR